MVTSAPLPAPGLQVTHGAHCACHSCFGSMTATAATISSPGSRSRGSSFHPGRRSRRQSAKLSFAEGS